MEGENIKVQAFDFETRKPVGIYDSICLAARRLFIRNATGISRYMERSGGEWGKTGVKSYKTETRYHFEKVKEENKK